MSTEETDDPPLTAQQMLEAAGQALTPGPNWPSALADLMGVTPDTVRGWCAGKMVLQVDHLKNLLAVVTRRRWELLLAEKRLEEWLAKQPKDPPP